jgi:RimJ/RimL family protein N-acetyltransferase
MPDTTYVDTLEWVKKIATVYIASYEKFLRAMANSPKKSTAASRGRETSAARATKPQPRLLIDNLDRYAIVETLRDGESISVRAVRAGDKARLLDHFARLSPASLYYRFLGTRGALTGEELDRFTRLDTGHAALVATASGNEEVIVGFVQYVRAQDLSRAQIACSVIDEHQGRGIGSLLFSLLSQIALANRITEFEGDVLPDNQRVLTIAAKNGRQVRQSTEAGVMRVCISLRPQLRPASERRTRASRRSRPSGSSQQRRSGTSGWLM